MELFYCSTCNLYMWEVLADVTMPLRVITSNTGIQIAFHELDYARTYTTQNYRHFTEDGISHSVVCVEVEACPHLIDSKYLLRLSSKTTGCGLCGELIRRGNI